MASLICVQFVFELFKQLLVINSVAFDFQCLTPSTIADLTMQNIFCDVTVTLNDERTSHWRHPQSLIDHSRTTETSLYPPTQTFCGFNGMCRELKVTVKTVSSSQMSISMVRYLLVFIIWCCDRGIKILPNQTNTLSRREHFRHT